MSLSQWQRMYRDALMKGGTIPLGYATKLAESVEETAEDPAVVAQRHLEDDLAGEL